MSETPPVKKRKRRPPATAAPTSQEGLLSPGDQIEFSMTSAVKKRGEEHWVKVGAMTVIRPGEDVEGAKSRIGRFVEGALAEQINDITRNT